MANTSAVYARIDTNLKERAENILKQLGISPSSAIQMLYSQIVLTKGMPLDFHLPVRKTVMIGGLDNELMKGIDSLRCGRTYSVEEVDAELAREYGI